MPLTSMASANLLKIEQLPNERWVRFYIQRPADDAVAWKSGFYDRKDCQKSVTLPIKLQRIAHELLHMEDVVQFHFSIGGKNRDHLSVKYADGIRINDDQLKVIADIIAELLG